MIYEPKPCPRYLCSVRPLVTQEEYETTRKVVERFESGVGRELQEKLLDHVAGKRNWVKHDYDGHVLPPSG